MGYLSDHVTLLEQNSLMAAHLLEKISSCVDRVQGSPITCPRVITDLYQLELCPGDQKYLILYAELIEEVCMYDYPVALIQLLYSQLCDRCL